VAAAISNLEKPSKPPHYALPATLPLVRVLVRDILTASPAYAKLLPRQKREFASSMVRVCEAGASLLREEHENRHRAGQITATTAQAVPRAAAPGAPVLVRRRPGIVSTAQAAGSDFSGVAASKVAGTTQSILNAVSFPRFVTDLINGVFKAILSSNSQQMTSYVELINNVSSSLSGFADTNYSDQGARQWLVDKFPGTFEISGGDSDSGSGFDDGPQLQLKDGAKMPSEDALKTALGLGPNDSISSGDPESGLVPFARAQMARQRQQMLATMVMLGMQRIVIDSGKINAAMHFHIDTRSAAQDDEGSTFNFQNQVDASGNFSVGPWGVGAKVSNTIGYVSTQRSQTTEEMNTDLDLNSSVEINFRSDYLPLNRMASTDQANRIRANTLNPEAEYLAAEKDRAAKNADLDKARWADLSNTLQPKSASPAPAASSPAKPAQPAQAGGGQQQQQKPTQGQPGQSQPAQTQPKQTPPAQTQPAQGQPQAQAPQAPAGGQAPVVSPSNNPNP